MDDILKRLTDYIAQCPSANGRTFHEMHEEVLIAHSADEIVKLRAALREIADMHELSVSDYNGMWWTYQRVARKALEGKDE